MNIRCLAIDDEPMALDKLKNYLLKILMCFQMKLLLAYALYQDIKVILNQVLEQQCIWQELRINGK